VKKITSTTKMKKDHFCHFLAIFYRFRVFFMHFWPFLAVF
jgi:hypothetical protein